MGEAGNQIEQCCDLVEDCRDRGTMVCALIAIDVGDDCPDLCNLRSSRLVTLIRNLLDRDDLASERKEHVGTHLEEGASFGILCKGEVLL